MLKQIKNERLYCAFIKYILRNKDLPNLAYIFHALSKKFCELEGRGREEALILLLTHM